MICSVRYAGYDKGWTEMIGRNMIWDETREMKRYDYDMNTPFHNLRTLYNLLLKRQVDYKMLNGISQHAQYILQ